MPTVLRNRKTGESFFAEGSKLVRMERKAVRLDEDTFDAVASFSFLAFSNVVRKELSHLSDEECQVKLRALYQEYHTHRDVYDHIFHDPSLVAEIHSTAEKCREESLAKWEEPSFLGTMAGVFLPAKLGMVGLVLSMAAPAVAQKAAGFFTTHTGVPPGGQDLCSVIVLGCDQGYLTKGTEPFQPGVDSQFVRMMNQAAQKSDWSSREQLRTCFDAKKMGDVVASVRNETGASATMQSCTTSSTPWNGWTVDTTTTNMPSNQCPILQGDISASVQSCKSALSALLGNAKISGIVIVSVVGLALILGGCYYAYGKCKDLKKGDAAPMPTPGPTAV